MARVVHSQKFENFILGLIIISTLFLAIDSPTLKPDSDLAQALAFFDALFTLIFLIELMLKVFTYGASKYMADPWNVLDGSIVAISLVSTSSYFISSFDTNNISYLRGLRALRALRPLRTIKRAPGLRMAVNTIFACLPAFVNIGMVAFVFYLAFAIIAVDLFGGKFWSCNDGNIRKVEFCTGYFYENGQRVQREWSNAPINFDSAWVGMLSLFEVAGLELWLDPMYAAMDLPKELGHQPVRNRTASNCVFFVVFILFGSFLVMNLFVGAVVDNFGNVSKKDGGDGGGNGVSGMMTEGQQNFVDSVRMVIYRKPLMRPRPPAIGAKYRKIRLWCYQLVMWGPEKRRDGTYFEIIVMVVVLLNLITMCCYAWEYPENDEYVPLSDTATIDELQESDRNLGLDYLNDVFTFVFTIEALIKVAAWGTHQYLQDHWNKVDVFVVIVSDVVFLVEACLSNYNRPINPNLVRILRIIKIMRVLRLLASAKQVLVLVQTLVYSFPAIANVGALWFLVLFIFTVMGMALYGDLDTDKDYVYGMYNEHANFR